MLTYTSLAKLKKIITDSRFLKEIETTSSIAVFLTLLNIASLFFNKFFKSKIQAFVQGFTTAFGIYATYLDTSLTDILIQYLGQKNKEVSDERTLYYEYLKRIGLVAVGLLIASVLAKLLSRKTSGKVIKANVETVAPSDVYFFAGFFIGALGCVVLTFTLKLDYKRIIKQLYKETNLMAFFVVFYYLGVALYRRSHVSDEFVETVEKVLSKELRRLPIRQVNQVYSNSVLLVTGARFTSKLDSLKYASTTKPTLRVKPDKSELKQFVNKDIWLILEQPLAAFKLSIAEIVKYAFLIAYYLVLKRYKTKYDIELAIVKQFEGAAVKASFTGHMTLYIGYEFVSNLYYKNARLKHLVAVILHELGHVFNLHLIQLSMTALLSIALIGTYINHKSEIAFVNGCIFWIQVMQIMRRQEQEADAFVATIHIEFLNALREVLETYTRKSTLKDWLLVDPHDSKRRVYALIDFLKSV